MPELLVYLLMGGAAFLAGLVDAIAGGGGLIQLPALMVLFPDSPLPALFGTNKLSSISGTGLALSRYAGVIPVHWQSIAPVAGAAFLGSLLGAWIVTRVSSEFLKPLVTVLLVAVALYTLIKKDFGMVGSPDVRVPLGFGLAAGGGIGFYDGFFGPGTGSFLVFAFVAGCQMPFLSASAGAKLVNLATNLAALCIFIPTGHIYYRLGILLAVCNMLGSLVGSRLAILHGSGLVRYLFLAVVTMLVFKLVYA